MNTTPWTFGWTQLLTIVGFLITIGIAAGGFQSFTRWKKEKIEEKRIDTAIEALALVYESRFVFEHIRNIGTAFSYEWEDMPESFGPEAERNVRGPFYATLKRLDSYKEFFERAWKVQVRCTALFGPGVEQAFLLMHQSRRQIQVSAEMLLRDFKPSFESEDNLRTWQRSRSDVWEGCSSDLGDIVGQNLTEFRTRIESLCRPIVDREFRNDQQRSVVSRISGWFKIRLKRDRKPRGR
jgi:hypothetical protein